MRTAEAIENLAGEIGEAIYIDVAKWHLYLADAHLHTLVAEKLYPLVESGNIQAREVTEVLTQVSVKVGGGKREIPLADLLPSQCHTTLIDLLEEFQRNL